MNGTIGINGTLAVNGTTLANTSAPDTGLFTTIYNEYFTKKFFGAEFFYYVFVTFAPLVSISLLVRFFVLSRNKHVHLSSQLRIHLFAWTIALLFCFLFFSTITWKKIAPSYLQITNITSEIIRGSLHIAGSNTISLSTFFLLVDRVMAIAFLGSRLATLRTKIQTGSIVVLSAVFLGNLSVLFYRTLINPEVATEGCTFSCRTNTTIKDLLSVKLVTSILNIICGSVFVYFYLLHAKSVRFKREKKLNNTIMLIFLTEMLCTIVPTSFYLLFTDSILFRSIQLSSMISMCFNIDGLLMSLLYWRTRVNTSNSVVNKLLVNPLMRAQVTKTSILERPNTFSLQTVQRNHLFMIHTVNTKPMPNPLAMPTQFLPQSDESSSGLSTKRHKVTHSKRMAPGTA